MFYTLIYIWEDSIIKTELFLFNKNLLNIKFSFQSIALFKYYICDSGSSNRTIAKREKINQESSVPQWVRKRGVIFKRFKVKLKTKRISVIEISWHWRKTCFFFKKKMEVVSCRCFSQHLNWTRKFSNGQKRIMPR